MNKEPPKVINDFAISPTVILAINLRAAYIINNALAVIVKPILRLIIFLGKLLRAKPNATNTMLVLARPSKKVVQCIMENIFIGSIIAVKAADNIIKPVAHDIIPLLSTTLVNIANSANKAPTPTKPFLSSSHFNPANITTALAKVFTEEAKANSLAAPFPDSPLPNILLDIATEVDNAIIPANEVFNLSLGISVNLDTATVNITRAPANAINPIELLVILAPIFVITALYTPNVVINVAIAPIAINISGVFIPAKVLTATDNISKADAKLNKPLGPLPPLVNLFIVIILPDKSTNKVPMAPKAGINSSTLIFDNTNTDAAIIPIATPIFNSISAFKLFWYPSNESFIPSIVSQTLSFISAKKDTFSLSFSIAPPRFFKKLPKSKKNLPAIIPVINSNTLPQLVLFIKFLTEVTILFNTSEI